MDELVRKNRVQCISALISCAIVVICVCVGVTMNLIVTPVGKFDTVGLRTFCLFTVNSNIFAAICTFAVIPYAVDGLRKKEYILPDWVVLLMMMGTTAVTLTFLVTLFILSPFNGFVEMFSGALFFLHGLCPILTILAFCLFVTSCKITVKKSLLSLIPVTIYAIIYFVMVMIITEENGGWHDIYGFATVVPFWVPTILFLPLTFGITSLIRLWHNHSFVKRRKNEAQIFLDYFEGKKAEEILLEMGKSRAKIQPSGDLIIPMLVIKQIVYFTESDLSIEDASKLYLDGYLYGINSK